MQLEHHPLPPLPPPLSEQEPGQGIVDQAVITGALNYILNNQEKDGRLPILGRVHNFGLVVRLMEVERSIYHVQYVVKPQKYQQKCTKQQFIVEKLGHLGSRAQLWIGGTSNGS